MNSMKVIHKEINNKKIDNIIQLLKNDHFLITRNLESICFKRRRVREDDIGDKFALIRLIQVQPKSRK